MTSYDQWGSDPRPPRKDGLDLLIFVGVGAVVLLLLGGPFFGMR